ncbi:MAG: hypothetical protein J5634_03715 [Bacilli bacterium]|nr:hypothetical protein [Bacilli bacterium]
MKNNKPTNMIKHNRGVNPHDLTIGFTTKKEKEYELKFMKAELLSVLSAIDEGKRIYRMSVIKNAPKTK